MKYLCHRKKSILPLVKSLWILDVSKNKIFTLSTMCVSGLPNLKIFCIKQNPLNSVDFQALFNLYSLPILKLDNLHLEHLGNSFFCSKSKNNLQILNISRNKLYRVSSKTFKCLHNLTVLFIYGNKFIKLLSEDVISNLPLIIYHVQDSLECCKTSVAFCIFVKKYPVACNTKDLPTNVLISIHLPLMSIGFVLNAIILVVLLFTGLYEKKPLQFLITLKDVIAILLYTSLNIFALVFHSLSEMVNLFCLVVGIISSLTLIFDLLVKVVESIVLLKLLNAKFIQNGPKCRAILFRVVLFLCLFTLTGAFIFCKFLSIEENVSKSTKLKETLLHCLLFCFPKHYSVLAPLGLILILLTVCITLNLKFIYSLKAQIFNMKDSGTNSLEHKKMITYISSVSLTTSCIMITLCLLLFSLLFDSSFFISYTVFMILWLYSMNNLTMFFFSNKTLVKNFKGYLSGNKI